MCKSKKTILFLIVASFVIFTFTAKHTASATSSFTISVTDNIGVNIAPKSTSGMFASSEDSVSNIVITTNHGTGYTLGLLASENNNNALVNTSDSTKTIPSISSNYASGLPESNYENDTYALQNNLNNTWGFKPSKYYASGTTVNNTNKLYFPGPTSTIEAFLIDKTSSANPSIANTYNVALGTRVDDATTPGLYAKTFVFTIVPNPSIYSITYNANASGDTVTNMPANVSNAETVGETVVLSNNTPVREGYDFKGWCTAQVADDASCSGTSYSAGGNWTIDQTVATNILTLYAVWESNTVVPGQCTSIETCMQTYTPEMCRTNASAAPVTLTDARDGKTYTVRYILGDCWMTQNLRIAGGTTLTSELSNVQSSYTIPTTSITSDDGSETEGRIQSGNDESGNPTMWYNYCAISAGTLCVDDPPEQGYVSSSICPANWGLPMSSSDTMDDYERMGRLNPVDRFNPVLGYYKYTTTDDVTSASYANDYGFFASGYHYGSSVDVTLGTATTTISTKNEISVLEYDGTKLIHSNSSILTTGSSDILGTRTGKKRGIYVRCKQTDPIDSAIITATFDSNMNSVTVNGQTISQSGATARVKPGRVVTVTYSPKSGYTPSTATITSGDATINLPRDELTVGEANSTLAITSKQLSPVDVSFSGGNGIEETSVVHEATGATITGIDHVYSLTPGEKYHITVKGASQYRFDGATVQEPFYKITNQDIPATEGGGSFDLYVGPNNTSVILKSAGSCVTPDTLITLSDGSKKRIADLTGEEEILVWDFDTASYSAAPAVFVESEEPANHKIIHLFFSDQTDVEVVDEHGFFDHTLNKYVYITLNNPEQYIGHEFIMQDGNTYTTVKLTNITYEDRFTEVYSLTTFKHFNYFTNDLLSIAGGITGMFNYFDVDPSTMGYDQTKKQADIKKYGLLTAEDFEGIIDDLAFEAYNGQYLNISIGKGLITWDGIKKLAERYGGYTASEEESVSKQLLSPNTDLFPDIQNPRFLNKNT